MEDIIQIVLQYLPTVVALAGEVGVIKFAINSLQKAKATREFKELAKQNEMLLNELRDSKKLNRELLTKIDHINRPSTEEGN